jgi:hypothetical protein
MQLTILPKQKLLHQPANTRCTAIAALFGVATAEALTAGFPAATQPVIYAYSFRVLVRQGLCFLCGDALQNFCKLGHNHPLMFKVALGPSLKQRACKTKHNMTFLHS